MEGWSFLTKHGWVLLCIAHDPGVRLRDIAATVGMTERSAYSIVTDLTVAGYVVKEKDGRRNRYHVQAHLPLPEPTARERTVGEVLALLAGTDATVTGESAAADQARGDLPPGEPPARPAAMADGNGRSPRSAIQGGRRQGRDRGMGSER